MSLKVAFTKQDIPVIVSYGEFNRQTEVYTLNGDVYPSSEYLVGSLSLNEFRSALRAGIANEQPQTSETKFPERFRELVYHAHCYYECSKNDPRNQQGSNITLLEKLSDRIIKLTESPQYKVKLTSRSSVPWEETFISYTDKSLIASLFNNLHSQHFDHEVVGRNPTVCFIDKESLFPKPDTDLLSVLPENGEGLRYFDVSGRPVLGDHHVYTKHLPKEQQDTSSLQITCPKLGDRLANYLWDCDPTAYVMITDVLGLLSRLSRK